MFFASDNSGPVHPEIMTALNDANQGYALPYGEDAIMSEVREQVRDLFEAPEAAVYLVATGTAANVLALSGYTSPWQSIYCAPVSHINVDECNAPEFFTGGAKLVHVGDSDKISKAALRQAITDTVQGDVHVAQRGPLSITQVTERGRVYSLEELNSLTCEAKAYDLPVHLDGARFSNALVALGCTPAEMTWKAGIDVVSFGGTKNGCMGVEAVIFFDPQKAWEFELRRKRGAHLFSKHRYLSAQMHAYLSDDLWRSSALRANANCQLLAEGLRAISTVRLDFEPEANMIFAHMPRAAHRRLQEGGAIYSVPGDWQNGDPDEMLGCRLVCDWSASPENTAQFLALVQG